MTTPDIMTAAAASNPRIIFFDTETNGLPKNRYAPVSHWEAYPSIIQLSWATYHLDTQTNRLIPESQKDLCLRLPDTDTWDAGAAAIHGVSEETARRGIEPAIALGEFAAALRQSQIVIAHNLSFDKPVVCAEGYRFGLRDLWPTGKIMEFCTMRNTRDILRIPYPSPSPSPSSRSATYSPYKAPRLAELYQFLYGRAYDISGATLHNAMSDVDCLVTCVRELLRRGYIQYSAQRLTVV
jgi:DNA polymerase-3 subunit epsilon